MKLIDISGVFLFLGWAFLVAQWVFIFTGPGVLWVIAAVLCFVCYAISMALIFIDKRRFNAYSGNRKP